MTFIDELRPLGWVPDPTPTINGCAWLDESRIRNAPSLCIARGVS